MLMPAVLPDDELPFWGSIALPLLLLFPNAHTSQGEMSLKLMPLSLESGKILKLRELTCPFLLCQKFASTCRVYSAVVFPEGSAVIGARIKPIYVKEEDILISCPAVAVIGRVVLIQRRARVDDGGKPGLGCL